jgi:simple sugar transport system ATP-binding protein
VSRIRRARPSPVKDLRVLDDRGHEAVKGVSFDVRAGEILGIAGVAGNGQDELVEALTGLRKPASGEVELTGKNVTGAGPRALQNAGMSFVPGDRHRFGLVLSFPLEDNLVLTQYDEKPYAAARSGTTTRSASGRSERSSSTTSGRRRRP